MNGAITGRHTRPRGGSLRRIGATSSYRSRRGGGSQLGCLQKTLRLGGPLAVLSFNLVCILVVNKKNSLQKALGYWKQVDGKEHMSAVTRQGGFVGGSTIELKNGNAWI